MSIASQRSLSVSEPPNEPVTLQEAKAHLLISPNDPTHDGYVRQLITTARQEWEHDTQSLTVTRTVIEKLPGLPAEGTWRFYYRPVESITSITYYDADNAQQTLDSNSYQLDAYNRYLWYVPGTTLPSTSSRWDAVEVTYVSGATIPTEISKHALKLKCDEYFETRGLAPNQMPDRVNKAYEMLVRKYSRASYY